MMYAVVWQHAGPAQSSPHTHISPGLFPSGFPTKTLYTHLSSPIRAMCPVHLILFDFITRTILGEEYKSFSSSLWEYVHIEDKKIWVYNIVVWYVRTGFDDRKCVGTEIKLCPVAEFRIDLVDEPSGFLTTAGERGQIVGQQS